ncbi:MAG: acyltransferase family protein [Amaricoccus sp.]|uniref:acyltransferase family protein n=1 Tax=Amaricoccus sp. TaxID=1872485 RepID=UPI0039E2B39D
MTDASPPSSRGWRREVDGLRAVAVLPVILFHAGVPAFAGGYLGVDVFFVISGFLITGILARDLRAGRFSIARFYERRARRILPALTVVLLACIPFGLAWMSPPELKGLGQGILATALSVSNVLFWLQLDYFGPDAHRLALLHTWSLGIEEQFYILFPPLLALLWHHRARTAILAVAGLASLAAAVWIETRHPSAGFFLLPFRAWELLLGGLAALALPRPPRGADALAAAGLAAIVAGMAAAPAGLHLGVLPNVLACAGTAAVLACARPGASATRLLSLPPLVGIGLVSYSAYLWHQPILAFARIRFGDALPPAVLFALGAAAVLLAWPTWAFVERPFRRPGGAPSARVLAVAGATIAGLAALGLVGIATNGLEARKPAAVRAILATVTDTNPHRETCKTGLTDPNPVHPRPGCLVDGSAPAVAFWGDSHADALQGAFFTAAEAEGFRFYSVTRSACPPVPGLDRTSDAASPACDAWVRGVEDYVARSDFPVVVLAARWTAGTAPHGFDNGEGGAEGQPGDVLTPLGQPVPPDREAAVIATYVRGIEALLAGGHRVVLVYPIPEAGWNVPEELARRREAASGPVTLTTDAAAYARRQAAVIAAFDAIDSPNLYRVRPASILCDTQVPGRCLNSLGDRPLYFDDNHLNNFGAGLVMPEVMRAIDAARRSLS